MLVERFDRNREQYVSPGYNETQLRREFLDPFFSSLGWDMENKAGVAEPYKEVIHEDSLKIGGETKAPDYGFRIGRERKFFVEAKKPSVNIKEDINPAFQLRRYAWNAKLPISILTDFQEFAVYDCRIQPLNTDKSTIARIKYLVYQDYIPKWDDIYSIFSRDAVWEGSFDKYVVDTRGKRGADQVDDAFLKDIESWRDVLARDIALRNPKLTVHELNFAVQRTIDRIIFLRICEDRSVETYGALRALVNGDRTYKRMQDLFYRADERYNSGLFHFTPEKGRPEGADEFTLDLIIDDKPLKEIIGGLYYPECPYEFSVFPADILGQVYEQFLGKVIRLTAGHQAKVEEKPEVNKAGGVYYTPTYIVDHIVKNTVGVLIEGKTPLQISALRILDPACGSGSFLIGAYQYLLDWHRDWYTKDSPEKWSVGKNSTIYRGPSGGWRLTTTERKRVLLNNIYGVDIDSQATEVTKLSLLLKVLEGENDQSISQQLKMFHERALPDLGNNIKCGNSLIGPDLFESTLIVDQEELSRINAFDWKTEFKEIMDGGGFDVVIGNPPYVRIQAMKEWAPLEVELYKSTYQTASSGNYDIYVVFVEKGLELLRKNGQLGFILPHKFFTAQYGLELRKRLAERKLVRAIVHFGDQQVFHGATTYTCLLFLSNAKSMSVQLTKVNDLGLWRRNSSAAFVELAGDSLGTADWTLNTGGVGNLVEKIKTGGIQLGAIAEQIGQGIRTSANEVYVLDLIHADKKFITVRSEILGKEVRLERDAVRLFLQGREIKAYRLLSSGKVVVIPYALRDEKIVLLSEIEIRSEWPLLHKYLSENKEYLSNREKGRFRGRDWYQFGRQQNIDLMLLPKILVPDTANRASFALDEHGDYAFTSGYGITLKPAISTSVKYILGILNSRVLDFFWRSISTPLRGGYFRYFTQYIEQFPIPRTDLSKETDKYHHDKMVELVDSMQELHKQMNTAKTEHEQTLIRRQIDGTDKQIDALVYELYGLTEEEIQIVEGGGLGS